MTLPCASDPDLFTAGQFTQATVDHLAATYCDGCAVKASCYRNAIRDERAWGVYGGVFFANGEAVPSQDAHLYPATDLRWLR